MKMSISAFSRKSILILISGAGGKAKGTGAAGAGLAGDGFLPLLPISNFIYEMVEMLGKNRMDAILGSPGQDVRGSRPGRFRNLDPFH